MVYTMITTLEVIHSWGLLEITLSTTPRQTSMEASVSQLLDIRTWNQCMSDQCSLPSRVHNHCILWSLCRNGRVKSPIPQKAVRQLLPQCIGQFCQCQRQRLFQHLLPHPPQHPRPHPLHLSLTRRLRQEELCQTAIDGECVNIIMRTPM